MVFCPTQKAPKRQKIIHTVGDNRSEKISRRLPNHAEIDSDAKRGRKIALRQCMASGKQKTRRQNADRRSRVNRKTALQHRSKQKTSSPTPATADKRAMENHDSFPKHCRTNESQQSRISTKSGCSDRRIQPRKASIGRTETSPIHALFASHWKSANKGTPKHQANNQAITNSEPSNKIARQKNDESCLELPPLPPFDSSTTSLREQNLPRFRGRLKTPAKAPTNLPARQPFARPSNGQASFPLPGPSTTIPLHSRS